MRILVLGICYSSPNLGDAVLCQSLTRRLQQRLPEAEVVFRDMLGHTEYPVLPPMTDEAIRRDRNRDKLRVLATRLGWDKEKKHELYRVGYFADQVTATCSEDWDAAVFAGGQMFQAGFALFLDAYVQQLGKRNIPVFFNACGTGHIYSPYIRQRFTAALTAPNVRLISTRDNAPLLRSRYLEDSGREVVEVTDPALWCADVFCIQREPEAQTVGLGIMYAASLSVRAQTKFWLGMIRLLEDKQVKWQFFVNGDQPDVTFARQVISQLPPEFQARPDLLAPTPGTPEELIRTIAGYRSIVSFRLHSHIIAASLGIPGVALYWDDKLPFFFRKLGHPERCKTVQTSPREIWDTLQAAENQGCPTDLVARQREESENILVEALCQALTHRSQP